MYNGEINTIFDAPCICFAMLYCAHVTLVAAESLFQASIQFASGCSHHRPDNTVHVKSLSQFWESFHFLGLIFFFEFRRHYQAMPNSAACLADLTTFASFNTSASWQPNAISFIFAKLLAYSICLYARVDDCVLARWTLIDKSWL